MPTLSLSDELLEELMPSAALCDAIISDCLNGRHPSEVPFLQPEHFRRETDRAAWKGLQELEASGIDGNAETLSDYLRRTARVDYVDWWGYCIKAIAAPFHPNTFNLEANARLIFDYANRRKMAKALIEQVNETFDLTQSLPASGPMPGERLRGVLHTAAEAFEPLPPIDWLIDKVLAPGMLCILYGKPATKKTYSALAMAACLATGSEWLHFKTRKARVLIFDQESNDRRLKMRVHECLNGALGDASAPIAWVTMAGYKLSIPADIREMMRFTTDYKADVVIIDSLADHIEGDENSVQYMQPVMNGLRQLTTTGAAVMAIHHSTKDGEIFRGSSSIEGALDLLVRVDSELGKPFVNFTMQKNRDGELLRWSSKAVWTRHENAPEKDQFYLEWAEGRKEESAEKELSTSEQYVMDYLREHGESGRQAIMNDARDCSKYSARDALYSLVDAGKVRKTNATSGGKDHPALYALSDGSGQQPTSDDPGP